MKLKTCSRSLRGARWGAALVAVLALTLPGCARVVQDKQHVLDAVNETQRQAREFSYHERAGGHGVDVNGVVQDDLRYSLDVSRDGTAVASAVVSDDTRALRLADATFVSGLLASGFGVEKLPDALKAGSWVVDGGGAASLAVVNSSTRRVGVDPMYDAITALEYVRRAMGQAQSVERYNPESENYRRALDPFPRPAAGIVRYDLLPPNLPPRQDTGQGLSIRQELPQTPFFRLMAIYVKDGAVVEVREKISVETRLRDPNSNLTDRLGDFVSVRAGASTTEQATALLDALNHMLPRQGAPPVRLRDLDLRFTRLGAAGDVVVPAGATPGDLSAIANYGQVLFEHD